MGADTTIGHPEATSVATVADAAGLLGVSLFSVSKPAAFASKFERGTHANSLIAFADGKSSLSLTAPASLPLRGLNNRLTR